MSDPNTAHEEYWKQEKLLSFEDYERNQILPRLFFENERVLDVGCGDGAVAEFLKKNLRVEVIGIDFSPTAVKRTQKRGVPTILSDIERTIPVQSHSFDAVFFGDVIEHMYLPHRALEEIRRALKPGGRLIISCPNMGYWRYRIHYLLYGIFPETEWIVKSPWESQHIRFFNKQLLYKLLSQYGFSAKNFYGISRRRLDKPMLHVFPELFGMIMVVLAIKT